MLHKDSDSICRINEKNWTETKQVWVKAVPLEDCGERRGPGRCPWL